MIMKSRQIAINAGGAVAQTIVVGITLFFLYSYLLQVLGSEKLGMWSLILASTSLARVANLGLSGSAVKFVAKYAARNDLEAVSQVLQTTLITVGLAMAVVLLVFYSLAPSILALFMENSAMKDALSILPYALLSVWLSMLYGVYVGGLDGFQRIDLRSGMLIISTLSHALLAVILVQRFDLVGLAMAQVVQYLGLVVASYVLLQRYVKLPLFPYQWNRNLFREMLDYGLNYQAISITLFLYDPITKALLARFGGLSMVGYYELASRLVLQVRSLIAAANQVLVPTIADLKERTPESVNYVYEQSMRVVVFVAIPTFSVLFAATPAISQLWIGSVEPEFVTATLLLTVGWFVNTLSVPIYFAYLGIGTLRWNTAEHILKAVINVLLGGLLGVFVGGVGVLLGWAVGLVAGSVFLIIAYHLENHDVEFVLLTRPNVLLMVGALVGVMFAYITYQSVLHTLPVIAQLVGIVTCWGLFIVIPAWRHPLRSRLRHAIQASTA